MGATKKRRQTKHRGNAAGMVEARGRTGAGRTAPVAGGKPAGGRRDPKPPSWRGSALKALMPIVILLPIMLLTQKNASTGGLVALLVFAYVMYLPMSYLADRWVYNRFVKRGGR